MGVRVRLVLLLLCVLAVTALAVPLALSLADRRTATLAAERGRQLAALADAAAVPDLPPQQLADRYHGVYGEGVLIVDADGKSRAASGLDASSSEVTEAVARALVDAPSVRWTRILPWSHRHVLSTAGVRRDGGLIGAVVVSVDTSVAAEGIAGGWLWVGLGCLTLIALAVAIASALTRWVLRPVDGLERAVAEMTQGVPGLPAAVTGPPELRHVTSAFNAMSHAVRASLERQRRLVADASHQLRNPLAAVRLRADALEDHVGEAGGSTYASMTAELDRLETLLRQLLRLAQAEQVGDRRRAGLSATATESTDLDDVIEQRIAFWRTVSQRRDQRLRCDDRSGLRVALPRHDVEQLIDVAVDNALRYAGDGATVTVSASAAAQVADLTVSDDGPGLQEADLAKAASRFWRGHDDSDGTGLGLAIAGEIAAGHGGSFGVQRAAEGGLLVGYRLPLAAT